MLTSDPMAPTEPIPSRFAQVLGALKSQLNLLPLPEAVRRLREGTLPPAAGAITFDDGYQDNFTVVAPLLREQGVPATFFVSSDYLDGGIMWNDLLTESLRAAPEVALQKAPLLELCGACAGTTDRFALLRGAVQRAKHLPQAERERTAQRMSELCELPAPPTNLMMTSEQVRGLVEQGFDVGAHTASHPILAQTDLAEAAADIDRGRSRLELITGQRVGLFAYPNGHWRSDFDERHVKLVEQLGFDAAFTTEPGVGRPGQSLFTLPRFTPWDISMPRFQARLLLNMFTSSKLT